MGRPKLALPFGAELMLQRVVRIVSEAVSPVVVVAASGQELPPLPDSIHLVRDEYDNLGPLAGLSAGLSSLPEDVDAAYVTACDTPLLTPAFIRFLVAQLGTRELAVAQEGTFPHPLAAVYRRSLLTRIRSLIEAGRLRPLFLIDESDANRVNVETLRTVDPDLQCLMNTNTPEEYDAALRIAGLGEGSENNV